MTTLPQSLEGALFLKSSHSQGDANTCVEVATNLPGRVAVRDSTNPGGAALVFSPGDWRRFTSALKAH